ncbi:hypothetical protein DCAR_0103817 [Daucus carota subsp. sativus]|uniref:Uncharacterized protein n=1 Tax=Daucus carota subsp. sativus TaxID=79200 RepID=A0A166IB53_DAUCS|nr:hypothetical protein DCAR_0103817 [Daucus carota subsp. sativus]
MKVLLSSLRKVAKRKSTTVGKSNSDEADSDFDAFEDRDLVASDSDSDEADLDSDAFELPDLVAALTASLATLHSRRTTRTT